MFVEHKMENKLIFEVRLSKPLMTVAVMATLGLLAIGVKPFIEVTPALASSNNIQKIAICDKNGKCADVTGRGYLKISSKGS